MGGVGGVVVVGDYFGKWLSDFKAPGISEQDTEHRTQPAFLFRLFAFLPVCHLEARMENENV